jgi:type II secretory pathway component PulC
MRLFPSALALCATSLMSLTLLACGETPPAKGAEGPVAPKAAPSTTAAAVMPKSTVLKRSQVKQTIGKGLGYFLQSVSVEDYPAMKGNKFYGWTIRSVSAELGVDLRPGDVVIKVNGMAVEHPEEADAAMRTLEKAPALRVDFERDGKPQTLELPITEE